MELAIIILGSIAVATGNLIIKNNKSKRNDSNERSRNKANNNSRYNDY
jgi:hypothetical protein